MSAGSTASGPTAARTLARTLRDAILDGRLTPGEPLREEALAATHGV